MTKGEKLDLAGLQPSPPWDAPIEARPLLAQSVYARLKRQIFDFQMPPGQRYTERFLAASLGISRTPLRLALHLLANEGYLNHVDGHSSWQVKPLDLDYYDDLYDFRQNIELLSVQSLCKRQDLTDLRELYAYWNVPKKQRVLDGEQVAREDERLHRTWVALAGNREMLRTFDQLTERIRIIRRLDFTSPERIHAAFDEHAAILKLLLARKAESAQALIKSHIDASRVEIRRITVHRLALASGVNATENPAYESR
jgi:DNA-binding GntR family transcriptional regulator